MYKINEESSYQSLYSNEDIIEALGEIDVYDEKKKSFVKTIPTKSKTLTIRQAKSLERLL